MKNNRNSVSAISLIWFGAAVSIAEILTGTYIAPLGLRKGMIAIVIGHLIGCVPLFFAGYIGGRTKMSAMGSVKISFGEKGAAIFACLNIVQLTGWTSVMIASGAVAAEGVFSLGGRWLWTMIIGALVVLWVLLDDRRLLRLNVPAMAALFILTVFMSFSVFQGGLPISRSDSISFGGAVELSAAMPLSWLPLIADHTRNADKPFAASLAASATYFATSIWMYVIGLMAALFTGENDIAFIMVKSGLGVAALLIVVFSTVTTTFLDAYSAGVSAGSISPLLKEKPLAAIVAVIGMAVAIFSPGAGFEDFLYLIGSVFAPMITIQLTDYFLLGKDDITCSWDMAAIVLWVAGFIIYRIFMTMNMSLGCTLPAMVITGMLCIVVRKVCGGKNDDAKHLKSGKKA